MSENSFIDLVEIEDCLSQSKCLQEEFQRKVSVLTDAIKILEDDSVSIPESIYGLLDGYKAQLNLEINYYNRLMREKNKIKEERNEI
jgi:hypothetical protein